MVTELELKVREMDDGSRKIYDSSKDIANKLNIALETVHQYLVAKRQNFIDSQTYKNFLITQRGFKNFLYSKKFRAQKRKFLDLKEYNRYLYHKKRGKFRSKRDFQEREGLLEGLEYVDPNNLDSFSSNKDYSLMGILEIEDKKEEINNLLDRTLKKLPEEYQLVIKARFYERKTLKEIGKEINKVRARAGQLEISALKKLSYLAKQSGLYDLYVEK